MGESVKNRNISNHKVIELVQPWSTDGYFIIKDKLFSIESGCIFILNAFETHCANTPDINKFCRNKIIISYDIFIEILEKLDLSKSVISLIENNPAFYFNSNEKTAFEIDALFDKATKAYNNHTAFSFAEFFSLTLNIFILLLKNIKKNVPIYFEDNKPINKALKYINNNLNTDTLTLDEICEYSNTSKYYLCHTFKETTGMSIMKYIKDRRINQAKKLLTETDIKIHDIGSMIGYSNSSLFCKVFKQEVGCSPLQYRNIR